jgi:hypothetical protein
MAGRITGYGKITKPRKDAQATVSGKSVSIPQLKTPTTPRQSFDSQYDGEPIPSTPVKQLMQAPSTPSAPGKPTPGKRRFSDITDEEEITLDTPPSRLLELLQSVATTSSGEPKPQSTRPESVLRRQGLTVTTSINRPSKRTSSKLVQQAEKDPAVLGRLNSLVDRGRRMGRSPTYTFKRGSSSIRYEYKSEEDVDHEKVEDESPRKKRRQGSPLTEEDSKKLKKMFCKWLSCLVEESSADNIQFDLRILRKELILSWHELVVIGQGQSITRSFRTCFCL